MLLICIFHPKKQFSTFVGRWCRVALIFLGEEGWAWPKTMPRRWASRRLLKEAHSQYSTSLQSLSRLALSILHCLSIRTLSLALLTPGYQERYYPAATCPWKSIFQNSNWPAHLSFLISFHCPLVSKDHLCPGLRMSWPTGSSTKGFAGSGWPSFAFKKYKWEGIRALQDKNMPNIKKKIS